mgnify:CR=1 FL=1
MHRSRPDLHVDLRFSSLLFQFFGPSTSVLASLASIPTAAALPPPDGSWDARGQVAFAHRDKRAGFFGV